MQLLIFLIKIVLSYRTVSYRLQLAKQHLNCITFTIKKKEKYIHVIKDYADKNPTGNLNFKGVPSINGLFFEHYM